MSAGVQAADLDLGVEGEFLFRERRSWLPLIVPPLIHRLNNSLLVLASPGVFPASTSGEDVHREEFDCLNHSLRGLALFAKAHNSSEGQVEVARLLAFVERLAAPYSNELGVELDLRVPAQVSVARGDLLRLHQWTLCLALLLISGQAELAGRELRLADPSLSVPSVRVSVKESSAGLSLHLCTKLPKDGGQAAKDFVGQHIGWCQAHGMRVCSRSLAGGLGFRVLLPRSKQRGSAEPAPVAPTQVRQNLILIQPHDGLRELLLDLFESESYRVQALASAERLTRFQLESGTLVLDLESLRQEPELRAALQAARAGLERMLLLGTPEPGELSGAWSELVCLPKPIRPGELLAAVAQLF